MNRPPHVRRGRRPRHWREPGLRARSAEPRYGLARVLSKLGYCSRRQAAELATAGRVSVNGIVRRDPEWPVQLGTDKLLVDGQPVQAEEKLYLMLNKPRGLVTTASDEKGRRTVFECLRSFPSPHLAAVGRLDQASEGLLLFTNDSAWAARLTDPSSHVPKAYHVQIDGLPDGTALRRMLEGVEHEGEILRARSARCLRRGQRHAWLELVLDQGRNRHIRRLLQVLGFGVLRLIRVAIGPLQLGNLAKGDARLLTPAEIAALDNSTNSRQETE